MDKKKLITSKILDLFEPNDEYHENIFIDDFCYFGLDKNLYSNKPYSIIELPTNDNQEQDNTYEYLKKVHAKLLNELHLRLNLYHGVNYQLRYWRIIIDPWLTVYINSTYEKFYRINEINFENINLDFIFFNSLKDYPTCYEYQEFEHQIRSVLYSQYLYQKILSTEYKELIQVKVEDHFKDTNFTDEINYIKKINSIQISNQFTIKKNVIKPIIILLDKILSIFFFKFKTVFIDINMPRLTYIWIQLKLLQMPRFFFSDFTYKGEKSKFDKHLRNSIQINLKASNKFEHFIYKDIVDTLPISIVEDFSKIQKSIEKINIVPKNVVFDNVLYGNFYIRFWLAFCSLNSNINLISHQHGGSIPQKTKDYDFEEEISDFHATWHTPIHTKDTQLPPIKLCTAPSIKKKKGKSCLLVPFSKQWIFQRCFDSTPHGIHSIDHINQYDIFFQNLNTDIQKNFSIKPDQDLGMNEEKIMRKLIPAANFITDRNLYKSFELAKIIICTYPETTFIEALASGRTTILVFPQNHWKFHPKFQDLVNRLEKENIIFYDPIIAANHINKIWDNPLSWWDSPETKKLRELTFKELGNPNDKNWIKIWKEFLN